MENPGYNGYGKVKVQAKTTAVENTMTKSQIKTDENIVSPLPRVSKVESNEQ